MSKENRSATQGDACQSKNPQAEGAPMTLAQYQQQAMTTCLPESENFSYMMLNLVGEVGELASKVAKMIRGGHTQPPRTLLTERQGNGLELETFET